MHDVAPCSSLCCELSRDDHAMRSHERSQWGELRSLRLRLSSCRVSAAFPNFSTEHPRVSVQFVVCSWRTLTLQVRVDSFGSKAGFLLRKPLRNFRIGRQVFIEKTQKRARSIRMVDFFTEFRLFSLKKFDFARKFDYFLEFPGKKPDFCETLIY